MATATETTVEQWLDEQQMEELQPPCDARTRLRYTGTLTGHCSNAAEWADRLKCDTCNGARIALHCDIDHVRALNGDFTCRLCREFDATAFLVSAERL